MQESLKNLWLYSFGHKNVTIGIVYAFSEEGAKEKVRIAYERNFTNLTVTPLEKAIMKNADVTEIIYALPV